MPPIRAPSNLPSLVKSAFTKAKQAGDLTYYPTQVAVLEANSIPFQLRFSPSLASKPKPEKPKDKDAKPFNPFENPLPSMTISDIGDPPTHVLVLNKFAIVPEHFILATKRVEPQTHVLAKEDIEAASACVRAYAENDQDGGKGKEKGLFVFFNSGEHSGASQAHRHLQMLPIERMRDGLDKTGEGEGEDWGVLTDKLLSHPKLGTKLPFAVLTHAISSNTTPEDLHTAYLTLYRRAVKLVFPQKNEADIPSEGKAEISYNFAMTNTIMALCPRLAEGTAIRDREGNEVGYIALNGTVLAGTALVKSEKEWDALRGDPGMLVGALEKIGVLSSPGAGERSGNL
ncbi:5',5'''-P-1,P-4-tetraphosphate phosphorylase 2 [Pseudomassariella vexata]|uniref:5',5'''-P-1,P-4-tetraphosphate phosphorylase 2 n=1 Tax=Pseudomassariella vexata TaxID=1141098 RepID=A0A1Y2DVW1_9PEZI|nr:5',5'''-P-1,P-4-tetraphosphate phosphorylase 2 [Pseudomassariella vexata]ORY63398.1 5',5'''-P-1,P-4-tetraphosphate phosphorylase 2 [Pseudomassariella vexata]